MSASFAPTFFPDSPFWFVVPAAGVGARMRAGRPKQYLQIHQQTILEHTLTKLCAFQSQAVVVALSDDDDRWCELPVFAHPLVQTVAGGAERSQSVLHALHHIADQADENDWVLVHDVARPCIAIADIDKLMRALDGNPVGGLLAIPVSDTIKRADENRAVMETVDRSQLWCAQTPQMFRFGLLYRCLKNALSAGAAMTDESSAVEWAGHQPLLVEGSADNIKITRPEDLAVASYYLRQD